MRVNTCCGFRLETGTWIIAVLSIVILALAEYFKNNDWIENLYFDVIYTIFSTMYLEYLHNGVYLRISLFIIPMLLLFSIVFKKPSYAFPWLCFKFTTLIVYFWSPLLVFAELFISTDTEITHDKIFNRKYNDNMLTSIICYLISSASQFYLFTIVHNCYNNLRSSPS